MKFMLTFGRRLWLLFLLMVVGLFVSNLLVLLLGRSGADYVAILRVGSVVQQLLSFLLPAAICALMSTRLPAELLGIRRFPPLSVVLLALLTLLVSVPAMNLIVECFEALPWPESIVAAEAKSKETVAMMIGGKGMADTCLALCVMAILPGLCEEIFFRGALQNLLRSRPMSPHLAIWLAALIFSLMHMQPIGAVPRMLLGAGFGYILFWTGSLWPAVFCHMLNNALVVIVRQTGTEESLMRLSAPVPALASALLTAAGLYMLWKNYSKSISSGM